MFFLQVFYKQVDAMQYSMFLLQLTMWNTLNLQYKASFFLFYSLFFNSLYFFLGLISQHEVNSISFVKIMSKSVLSLCILACSIFCQRPSAIKTVPWLQLLWTGWQKCVCKWLPIRLAVVVGFMFELMNISWHWSDNDIHVEGVWSEYWTRTTMTWHVKHSLSTHSITYLIPYFNFKSKIIW